RFQPFAEQALVAMEHGHRAIRNGAEPSGPLRISTPESILTYRLPPVLRVFRRRFPNDLEAGKIDIASNMCDTVANPLYKSHCRRTERIFLFGEPSHPLANRRTVKPSDLAG